MAASSRQIAAKVGLRCRTPTQNADTTRATKKPEFTLSWEEFEKALHRNNFVGGEFEVLAIYAGGRPC